MNQWLSTIERASVGPFGQAVLSLSFLVALFGLLFAAVGAYKRQPRYTEAALQAVHLFTGLIIVCTLLLVYALFSHDFSVKYVQDYSNATQATMYRITALWGGQAGSLLFWTLLLTFYGSATFGANRERLKPILPHSIAVYLGICIFFASLLLLKANPFEMQVLGEIPNDGKGMNPLLQTPLMSIHPPSLYMGYVGFAIPFCFAMGALMANRLDAEWIRATRKATMVSFAFLSVGNILGSWWAYEEIGWGGFWAWDPVETAAFFPWLTGTAFLHSVMIQERKGMFKVWNVVLISLTFFLTILGTMLTRSGLVQSVHSFANSRVGGFFGVFLLCIFLLSLGLIILRWKALRTIERGNGEFNVLSREFSFLVQNVILTVMAITLVVFVLTPMFTKEILPWIQANLLGTPADQINPSEATMGPRFYNIYMAPMALTLIFLMGVGPLIPWRKATPKELLVTFRWPLLSGVAGAIACLLVGVTAWFPMITFILASFTTATMVQEFIQGTNVRRRTKGEDYFTALSTLILKGKRRYGGYIVHFGMIAVFIGIAGAYYQGQRSFAGVQIDRRAPDRADKPYDFSVDPWKTSFSYGGYDFHYYDARVVNTPDTDERRTYVAIKKEGKPFGILTPGRNWYRTHPDQPSSEIDVKPGLSTDLYMSLASQDEATAEAAFVVTVNPLIFWLWLGLFVILLGSGVCLAPELQFQRSRGSVPAVATAMIVGLMMFLFAPMAMAQEPAHDHDHSAPSGVVQANGVIVIDYPAEVKAAAGKLVCRCPCGQIVSTCAMPQCECVEDRQHMTEMVKGGAKEKDLMDWYIKSYGSRYLAIDSNSGLGAQLGSAIWLIGIAGIGVLILLAMFLTRRKQQPAIAGSDEVQTSKLSIEEEKKLSETMSRLE
jgi:cytochrome c-type biogenesis protein CcmF